MVKQLIIMKKLFTLLAVIITFSLNAQVATNGTNNSGIDASAIGREAIASGLFTTAMGYATNAVGAGSVAMGWVTYANGSRSVAMGFGTIAGGEQSTAMGHDSKASGLNSTAMGFDTEASGSYSSAIGRENLASGYASLALGYKSVASGGASSTMGYQTISSDYGSLVIGQNNLSGSTVTSSGTNFNTLNTAFVIGNGNTSNAKSDAFKVKFNGDTTISNDLTVGGDIVVSSDARLKANIVSLGSTLAKLLLIDGKSYTMKKNGKQKIGVLAQDIQKVFPELVTTDDKEMLAVNYQGLVPVLINAIKEQDDKISRLEKLVEKLISDK